jgi:hypothetical protein
MRKEMEKFQVLYNQNLSSIKASEGLATILNQQRNPKLKIGLGIKRDQAVVSQEMKNPSSLSKLQPMTITILQKQRKTISRLGRVRKKMPDMNLKNKEVMCSLLNDVISLEEIDLLKEENHFPGTKNYSMAIVSTMLTFFTIM